MLTKQDLEQIKDVVGDIVEEKVNASIDSRVGDIVEEKVNASIDTRVGSIVDQRLDKKLMPIKKDLKYLKKTLDMAIRVFDENDVKLDRRVKFIEDHLGIQHKN